MDSGTMDLLILDPCQWTRNNGLQNNRLLENGPYNNELRYNELNDI